MLNSLPYGLAAGEKELQVTLSRRQRLSMVWLWLLVGLRPGSRHCPLPYQGLALWGQADSATGLTDHVHKYGQSVVAVAPIYWQDQVSWPHLYIMRSTPRQLEASDRSITGCSTIHGFLLSGWRFFGVFDAVSWDLRTILTWGDGTICAHSVSSPTPSGRMRVTPNHNRRENG